MFTGIVEERGTVASVEPLTNAERIAIRGSVVLADVRPGDSIAVNGVCLTVVEIGPDSFTADVMEETLKRSSLGSAGIGSEVNLERAARLDSRLGGHLVQGHVDGTGQVLVIEPDPHWTLMRISLPAGLARYVVEKGSITVDGVSLTVVSVDDEGFSVSLIPTTLAETTLGSRRVGDTVNLEVDAIAKYVERLMQGRSS
ncbi:MAG: riboflavin synthase [Actinobacteria bacterium]|jgi:riboflavin synthase|uniref:Riboflavin synthase n=1 Tax=freshwater metagenome TaxID=449393 RepID=A0A6J7JM87_9ZZZZ|nr:riboflavin synthase [Actinomycetota bacterium]